MKFPPSAEDKSAVSRPRKAVLLCSAGLALAATGAQADTDPRLLPPLSGHTARNWQAHPELQAGVYAQLAKPGMAVDPSAALATGSTWTALPVLPGSSLTSPAVMTDGTVLVHGGNAPNSYQVTPDSTGYCAFGTSFTAASMPLINGTQYQPLYAATVIPPDGRRGARRTMALSTCCDCLRGTPVVEACGKREESA